MNKLLIILFIWGVTFVARAQTKAYLQTEIGQTNVSEGFFLKSILCAAYSLKGTEIATALESSILATHPKVISAWNLSVKKAFDIRQTTIFVKPYFIYAAQNQFLKESNWGVLLHSTFRHWQVGVGQGFRTMFFDKNFSTTYKQKLHENFIFLYDIRYQVLPETTDWEAGLSVTNMDYFKVHQSTNPIFSLDGAYKINDCIRLTAEMRYITAGMFNLHINYFGLIGRVGAIYNF